MESEAPVESFRFRYRLAAGVAIALLLGSGAGYWWLADRYARASESVPIPPGTLARLPLEIGEWIGRDVPLDAWTVRASDTDDHLNRQYTHTRKAQQAALWLAYGVRTRDLMPHRPEVCYPGTGWTFEDARDMKLTAADGAALPCRLLHFSRGGLRDERISVLSYYLVDGESSADVSAVRKRARQLDAQTQYVAQLQVTSPATQGYATADQAVTELAAASAAEIRSLLTEAVGSAMAAKRP
jgi:EpsI family protein